MSHTAYILKDTILYKREAHTLGGHNHWDKQNNKESNSLFFNSQANYTDWRQPLRGEY
jgi:hypothetical protein